MMAATTWVLVKTSSVKMFSSFTKNLLREFFPVRLDISLEHADRTERHAVSDKYI